MSGLEPGNFWNRLNFTLRSSLAPQQVHEQLSRAAPQIDVQTGRAVSGLAVFRQGRIFTLRAEERAFRMSGPLAHRGFRGLYVRGSVKSDDRGSIVHHTVQNAALAVPLFIGAVLIALVVCAVVLDYLPVIVFGGVPLIFLGFIQFLVVSIRARKALEPLVLCLENMLRAQRAL